ncbi:nucleotidyl transferase AbiEii/AbiGii toxin family protein [Marinobacter sp. TBZ242]|uniref:Nucleotidyl transferase AbiEii/AbiGii toxin family protein n=1 Tax=Marinobacter azerbaijanicus TaxID=3050455 RepID=A0ABT7IBS5_9GAMM|nr:nucleotidyl transferase AbiEii/AbiGii toxin family protein [Marinobacter sp. TBZ242]MDL0431600.1 nucleotidyl transferase AbiEii/AbiGii toxin family protein [Marinobacter sp. TBZ242]
MRKYDQENFQRLVSLAMQDPNLANMRPVIEKEIIHFDLFFALDQEGLLNGLVFQGGTAVRLCYGGKRFSEDLDFAGGVDFSSQQLGRMKECILDYLSSRYGLEVSVKEPKSLRKEPQYSERNVDMWQIAITTSPERPDLPKQRVKLEVANIPAYTAGPQPLIRTYDFLPDGYEDILIMTEDRSEIMADKLVSLPATQKYTRHRDIWDLAYLSQERASVRADLVANKVRDYQIENYDEKLEAMIGRLPQIIEGKPFRDEMNRFLPADVIERTLAREKFSDFLLNRITSLLTEVRDSRESDQSGKPPFSM